MNGVENFLEGLEELSAALVIVDPENPGSYQTAMNTLDRLSAHGFVQGCADVQGLVARIQTLVEECIFQPELYSERLAQIEEHLETLQRLARSTNKDDCVGGLSEPTEGRTARRIDRNLGLEPDRQSNDAFPPTIPTDAERTLYEDFLAEARESIESIELRILDLEQDPQNRSVVDEIFRPFHTIKGVAGFLHLKEIGGLTHAVEDLLDRARKGKLTVGKAQIDLILEAVDLLRRLLDCVWKWLSDGSRESLSSEVEAFIAKLQENRTGGDMNGDVELPGKAALSGEDENAQQDPRSSYTEDRKIEQNPNPGIGKPRGDASEPQSEAAGETGRPSGDPSRPGRQVSSAGHGVKGTPTIKVDMHKLDNLVNMVGELVIAESLIAQHARIRSVMDHSLSKDFGQLARITSELRNTAMSLRMVPIRQTFEKMIRLVRDLTQKSGKSVQLLMEGAETEIDRNMVDAIYEPLVHLVRNSIDHGLELPEERRQAGKPEKGTLELRSYQKGGNVVIEVADDGRGLNRERILAKARQLGLVGAEERLSDAEIDEIIFRPGFSTAREVTDVSGRGVGMDVVRKAVEGLRGKIEVRSRPGEGSTFVMRLPITLAIIDGMVVRVGGERFIVPTVNIREAMRPRREECFTVEGRGETIEIRGTLLPVIRLHELLHIEARRTAPWEGLVIVAENQGEKRCLLVDEVLEKQEVVIKSLGKGFQQPEGIAGGCILGDGRVGLILDVAGLFRLQQRTSCGMGTREKEGSINVASRCAA